MTFFPATLMRLAAGAGREAQERTPSIAQEALIGGIEHASSVYRAVHSALAFEATERVQ
jgi:hypothetical protein